MNRVREQLYKNPECKPNEHEYDDIHVRLRGFPEHDYFVRFCKKCGRDKPDK